MGIADDLASKQKQASISEFLKKQTLPWIRHSAIIDYCD